MRKIQILALILVAGVSVAACDIQAGPGRNFDVDFASGKATDTWSRTYKVPENGRFELINVNGKITAEPTDGAELVVEGHRSAKASSDEAAKVWNYVWHHSDCFEVMALALGWFELLGKNKKRRRHCISGAIVCNLLFFHYFKQRCLRFCR